jgi:hypothetical protein
MVIALQKDDTIIVDSAIEEQRQGRSYVTVEVTDPRSKIVEYWSTPVTAG